MKNSKQVVKDWLDALKHPRHELTKWEEDFIASVTEQFKSRGSISDRQEEILERVYAEKT